MAHDAQVVLVVDFGAQYGQLIARRVRECKVYCEIVPSSVPWEEIASRRPRGLIFSGGPASVYAPGAPTIDRRILEAGIPILGICYGMQLMTHLLGGKVSPAERREYGRAEVRLDPSSPLFADLGPATTCWMSHGDSVLTVPRGFRLIGETPNTPYAAVADEGRGLYGVQFHPEVAHTPQGLEVLKNFLYRVCGCEPTWTMASFVEEATRAVAAQVGKGQVLCALSGGVDSAVAAALVHRAVGDQLTAVFVDHGLLRQGEAEEVAQAFGRRFGDRFVHVDASERFLRLLAGVADPEEKRRLIGNEFIRVFESEARRIGPVDYLVQGTLYPDVIESGGGAAATIKTHHNVGGIPADMQFKLIEPLRELFKDEVRELGLELGLPEEIVWRQPFPGPGLAIRVIGEVTPARLGVLRQADAVVRREIRAAGLHRRVQQYFAVLTDLRSVGVMGDERTYGYTVAVRAVTTGDFMTADWARLPDELLARISNRICNEVPQVNRVVYDITSKPPGTVEWE